MDKNYGRGLVFDVARPFSPQMDSRPRAYDAIPALHKLSLFLEDATTLALGDFRVEATGGVRAASMFNLGRRYTIQGKFYFDPRANVVVALPRFHVAGRNLTLRLGGGVGWHTKFPTMDSLYPDMSISISPSSTTGLRIPHSGGSTCDSTRSIRRITTCVPHAISNGRFASTPAGTTTSCR